MIRLRHFVPLLFLPTLACSGGSAPPPIQSRVTVTPFQSCGELTAYIEDQAVREMKSQLDQYEKGGYYPWGGGPLFNGGPVAAGAATPPSAPVAYTTTNTQVKGVDEADFVKNDGTHLYTVRGRKLYALTTWPPQATALAGELDIEGYPSDLFLDEKQRLVVLSRIYTPEWAIGASGLQGCDSSNGFWCGYSSPNTTKLTVIDASDTAHLKVVNQVYLPGSYTNTRRIGSSVRVVLSDLLRYPEGLRYWLDYDANNPHQWDDEGARKAGYEALKVANEKLLRGRGVSDWLPAARHVLADGSVVDMPYSCGDFAAPSAPTHLGLLTIATVDLDRPFAQPARTSLVAESGGVVYASKEALYVATPHWWWWWWGGDQRDYTYIHKFDLTNPERAAYVGSGGVEGTPRDQFSFDEYLGYLRVSSTSTSWSEDPSHHTVTSNRVTVLGEKSGSLITVGQTPELASGERIYATRFVGDRGFLVTFRQVDPLITLDLSSPSAPRVVAELTIPGFSTYLQPIDGTHLVGIGVDQPVNGTWQDRRIKLSLFDVSDLANPRQTFTTDIGSAYSYSESLWDHHAFNYFAERGLLAIPFSDWTPTDWWDNFYTDVRVFNLDVNKGISQRGGLSMRDLYYVEETPNWSYYWTPAARRSIMATDASGVDYVYGISDAGVRVARADALWSPLATVRFDKPVF